MPADGVGDAIGPEARPNHPPEEAVVDGAEFIVQLRGKEHLLGQTSIRHPAEVAQIPEPGLVHMPAEGRRANPDIIVMVGGELGPEACPNHPPEEGVVDSAEVDPAVDARVFGA
eukprot:354496-Chlamydomonas_euryale.AAC.1